MGGERGERVGGAGAAAAPTSLQRGWAALNTSQRTLALPAGLLTDGTKHTIHFAAWVVGSVPLLAASAAVRVSVRAAPAWRLRIGGCDRRVGGGESVVLSAVEAPPATEGWRLSWACSPAPCAAEGSALAALLAAQGEDAPPAALEFSAADLIAPPANASDLEYTFTVDAEADAVENGYADGAPRSQHALCSLRVAPAAEAPQLSLGVSVAPQAGGPAAGGRLVLRAELGALADANGAGLSLEWEEGFGADGAADASLPPTTTGWVGRRW